MGKSKQPEQELTPIELAVMRTVWDGKVTTREIHDGIPAYWDKPLAFSTIGTYIQRLIQKGYLQREATQEREYLHKALVAKEDYRERMRQKVKALYASDSEMLQQFAGNTKLSSDDRRKLREIIENLKRREAR